MRYSVILLLILALAACKPETYTPKPRGYFQVEFPARGYQQFNDAGFPYSFEYPKYGKITNDTSYAGHTPENPYWINIDFEDLGGRVYVSYKTITAAQPLSQLVEDAYTMTYKAHDKKADYIEPVVFHNDSAHVHGLLYNVGGNAASAYQFFATDSVKHFIRGALYFNTTPNADSLKPMNDFLFEDIKHMMETTRWK
jgi:gliding motility-associated lipoprotein GldD